MFDNVFYENDQTIYKNVELRENDDYLDIFEEEEEETPIFLFISVCFAILSVYFILIVGE